MSDTLVYFYLDGALLHTGALAHVPGAGDVRRGAGVMGHPSAWGLGCGGLGVFYERNRSR